MARQARSSRVYPVPGLVMAPVRLDGATGNGTKAGASGCAGRPLPLNGAGPRGHPRTLADSGLARLAPMTPQSPVFLKLGPAVTYSAHAGDWGRRPVQVTLPAAHPRPAHRSMTVMVRGIYLIDPSGAADFRPYLLIRSSMCGHPDPFGSVRDLGCVLARCSYPSGISETRSSRWLPAWLPASDGLVVRLARHRRSANQA